MGEVAILIVPSRFFLFVTAYFDRDTLDVASHRPTAGSRKIIA
jgi:hypothetical protein